MAVMIPLALRRNSAFQADFRRLFEAPAALLDALLSEPEALQDLGDDRVRTLNEAHDRSPEDILGAAGVLRWLVERATPERVAALESDIRDMARRLSIESLEPLTGILGARLKPGGELSMRGAEARALRSLGGVQDIGFRPTVVLGTDTKEGLAFAGLLCEIHYHDSDDVHHDISFALTPSDARKMAADLAEALDSLNAVLDAGSVAIANSTTSMSIAGTP